MQENEREVRFVAARNTEHDYLDEREIAQYWRLLAWPVAITLMVLFFAIETTTGFSPWREWLLKGVMFLALTIRARQEYGHHLKPVLYVSVLAGLVLGLGSTVLRLVEDFAFYKLFMLLTIPTATALLGLAVSWGTIRLSQKFGTLSLVRLLPQRQAK